MFHVQRERLAQGDECWAMWGRGRAAENDHEFNFGTKLGFYLDVARTRLDDRAGFHSRAATRRLLAKLDEIDPDVVHLHNLHGYHLNVEMLFGWLSTHRCRVRWTLHDCWAFTGHCAYFTRAGCNRWRDGGCARPCPQKGSYPESKGADASARNFADKRRVFTRLPAEKMTIVTPSRWLAGLVQQSFLGKYPVEVRPNEVDRAVFKPTPGDFRMRHGIGDRFMVLGVASPWDARKGLEDFVRLSGDLGPDVAIVLVGLDDGQRAALPAGIIRLGRTDTQADLAAIYTAADVLFNPTREDNLPSVLLEAQACGTPVLTYDVGGCAETLELRDSRAVASYAQALETLRAWPARFAPQGGGR